MLRRSLAAAAILCVTLALAPKVYADAATDARKAIQAQYDKMAAAFAKKDAKTIISMHDPAYEATDGKGQKMTLAQLSQVLPMVMQQAQSIKSKTTIQKFSLKGKEAIVTTKSSAELTMMNPQTQKPARVQIEESSEDTWVKGAKGWLMKHTKALSQKQTLDGKPVPAR